MRLQEISSIVTESWRTSVIWVVSNDIKAAWWWLFCVLWNITVGTNTIPATVWEVRPTWVPLQPTLLTRSKLFLWRKFKFIFRYSTICSLIDVFKTLWVFGILHNSKSVLVRIYKSSFVFWNKISLPDFGKYLLRWVLSNWKQFF